VINTKLFTLGIFAVVLVSMASATVELGGQSGKDVLIGIGNGTGLWDWGEAPLGHIINDSKLIAGSWIVPEDRSSMQTPLQASGMGQGGFANAPYVNNIAFELSTLDNKPYKSAEGVFDSTCFRPPMKASSRESIDFSIYLFKGCWGAK
jgi:hypothetical protein